MAISEAALDRINGPGAREALAKARIENSAGYAGPRAIEGALIAVEKDGVVDPDLSLAIHNTGQVPIVTEAAPLEVEES